MSPQRQPGIESHHDPAASHHVRPRGRLCLATPPRPAIWDPSELETALSPRTHRHGSPRERHPSQPHPLLPPDTTVAVDRHVAALCAASRLGKVPFGSYLCPIPSRQDG